MPRELQRCFIALAPDAAARARLCEMPVADAARRVHPADLHLTLAFLGPITPAQHLQLQIALPGLAGRLPPLALDRIEDWPGGKRPHVTVATFALPAELEQVMLGVQAVVREAGLPVETRRFRPHVTLARHAAGQGAAEPVREQTAFEARFDLLALYASCRNDSGPRYTALTCIPL